MRPDAGIFVVGFAFLAIFMVLRWVVTSLHQMVVG